MPSLLCSFLPTSDFVLSLLRVCMGLEQNNHPQLGCAEVNGMLLQNDTLHVWHAKSHAACQLLTEGGTGWAPGGDLLYSTSKDGGRSWSNTTVSPCR